MNDNHPAGHGPTRAVTVADVLALPVLAAGQPQVVTGVPHLDRPVGWVHITELTERPSSRAANSS